MKKLFAIAALLVIGGTLVHCSDDDAQKKEGKLIGTWDVTDASGVEWEEDEGVVNINDPDPELIGETFTFTATELTISSFGTFNYTFEDGILTLELDGETEPFMVEFDGPENIELSQGEPEDHSDYDYHEDGDKYLYYQKFFSLVKQ